MGGFVRDSWLGLESNGNRQNNRIGVAKSRVCGPEAARNENRANMIGP